MAGPLSLLIRQSHFPAAFPAGGGQRDGTNHLELARAQPRRPTHHSPQLWRWAARWEPPRTRSDTATPQRRQRHSRLSAERRHRLAR